jgi:DNA-binding transcriptional regulator YiaG
MSANVFIFPEVDTMNNSNDPQWKEKFTTFCNDMLKQLADNHTESYGELLALQQELHTIYLDTTTKHLKQWAQKYGSDTPDESNLLDKIEADSVVVEIIDSSTGKVFRRSLPIKYLETANGLLLAGETMEGTPSQIAFLSETAITKINDLLGKGPDAPRCGDKS